MGSEKFNTLNVNLSQLASNYEAIKSKASPSHDFYCVLKSDAYGHGYQTIAKSLINLEHRLFCVDSVKDGIYLKTLCPQAEVILMSPPHIDEVEQVWENEIIPFIISEKQWELLKAKKPQKKSVQVVIHCNIGLNRFGLKLDKLNSLVTDIKNNNFQIHSVSTHLINGSLALEYSATDPAFQEFLNWAADIRPQCLRGVHAFSTSALLAHVQHNKEVNLGLRVGSALYGLCTERANASLLGLQPIMSCWSEVIRTLKIKKGDSVSYRKKWVCSKDSLIGVIALGYAHGFYPPSGAYGLYNDQKVPIIGAISMGYSMIDLTELKNFTEGDKVFIFGQNENQTLRLTDYVKTTSSSWPCRATTALGGCINRTYSDKSN